MAVRTRQRVPPFTSQQLEAIAKVLADTGTGLTGSQIGHLLSVCQISDPNPSLTKWKRLYNALAAFQHEHHVGNHVVVFIQKAIDPVTYTSEPEVFQERRGALNGILALCGMTVGEDGKLRYVQPATTLDEVLARADRLKDLLRQRNVHADVLKYCNAEIVAKNYFHAVFEAMKSVAAKLRALSGLTLDGAALVDAAVGFSETRSPLIAINAFNTPTLRGEQRGFASLLTGLYGTIRNPLAHDPKIEWDMSEQDALDILTMLSLIHRKLDKAYRHGTGAAGRHS